MEKKHVEARLKVFSLKDTDEILKEGDPLMSLGEFVDFMAEKFPEMSQIEILENTILFLKNQHIDSKSQ